MFVLVLLVLFTAIGFWLRSVGVISDQLKNWLHKYVYYVAVPAAIVHSLSGQLDSGIGKYAVFLIANIAAYLLVFFSVSKYALQQKYSYKKSGVLRFSSNTPNTVFLGFPLILILFNHSFFIYAVIIGSLADAILNTVRIALIQKTTKKQNQKPMYMAYVKNFLNPLSIALGLVCLMAVMSIHIPAGIDSALGLIGKTSSYIALLVLGASIYGLRLQKKNYRALGLIATLKLIVLPLAVLLSCLLFNISPEARNISVMISALPVAVFSLIVADSLNLDEQIAAGAILVTTCLAPLSLLVWFLILKLI